MLACATGHADVVELLASKLESDLFKKVYFFYLLLFDTLANMRCVRIVGRYCTWQLKTIL